MADAVDPTEGSMSLLDHLTELRNRIGIVFIAFVVIFLACFIRPFGSGSANIADLTYHWLQAPLAARESPYGCQDAMPSDGRLARGRWQRLTGCWS